MKVKRNTLLLFACLVWSAADFNILRIGLISYPPYRSVLNFLLSILVFAVFQKFIFGKLVKKHTTRIRSYKEERHWLLYPGGAVGGYHSHDWNAHDPQDLRLCVDRADRLLCHEKRVQIKE